MPVDEFVEFQKQYEKTFIRVKFENSDSFQVVQVRQCLSDEGRDPYIVIHSPLLGSAILQWGDTNQLIDYEFPKVGLFNHEDCFLMFNRFPDRQWKRGIYTSNTHISDPLQDIRAKIPRAKNIIAKQHPVDYYVLSSAFSESFPESIDNAVVSIKENNLLGVALNPLFGLTKNPTTITKKLVLWKHLSMIGYLDEIERTIEVVEHTFEQEVIDFLKRKRETSWSLK